MVKFPANLEEWSRGFLIDLIDMGYDENLKLEFKSIINEKTKKIPTTACAFANSGKGYLIFGVDNDRKKKITTEERLIGLEDSDNLKSKIENQIREIKPPLPTESYKFKESNIKLPNERVIVILEIEKSQDGPHQFGDKFWKRVANGNAVMKLAEIKNMIIKSQRSDRILFLLEEEETILRDVVEAIQIVLEHKDISKALSYVTHLHFSAFKHFLYNYTSFHDKDIQKTTYYLIEELERLMRNSRIFRESDYDDEEFDTNLELFSGNINSIINSLDILNNDLGIKPRETKNGFKPIAEKYVKDAIEMAIKKAPKETEEIKLKEQNPSKTD